MGRHLKERDLHLIAVMEQLPHEIRYGLVANQTGRLLNAVHADTPTISAGNVSARIQTGVFVRCRTAVRAAETGCGKQIAERTAVGQLVARRAGHQAALVCQRAGRKTQMIVVRVGQRDADLLFGRLERTDCVPERVRFFAQPAVFVLCQPIRYRMLLDIGKRVGARRLERRPACFRIARIFTCAVTGSQSLNGLGVLFAVGNQTLVDKQRRQLPCLGNCCIKRGLILFFVRIRRLTIAFFSGKQRIQILLCIVASCLELRCACFRVCLQGKSIVAKTVDLLQRFIKRGGVQSVGGNQPIDLCLQRSSCCFNVLRGFCGGQCLLSLFARTIFRRKRCPKTTGLVFITVVAITGLIPVCFFFAGYRFKQTCERFFLLIGQHIAFFFLYQHGKCSCRWLKCNIVIVAP